MKRFILVLCAMALICGASLLAQTPATPTVHQNEKKAADEITVSQPVMVGSVMLKAGRYRIACDEKEVTFTFVTTGEKVLTVPCKGRELDKKVSTTEVYLEPGPSGTQVVSKILLKGSNVEHTF